MFCYFHWIFHFASRQIMFDVLTAVQTPLPSPAALHFEWRIYSNNLTKQTLQFSFRTITYIFGYHTIISCTEKYNFTKRCAMLVNISIYSKYIYIYQLNIHITFVVYSTKYAYLLLFPYSISFYRTEKSNRNASKWAKNSNRGKMCHAVICQSS